MKKKLNIGFDAKRLFHNKSGLGNYSRWLAKSLAERHKQNNYHLYTPGLSNNLNDFDTKNFIIHQPTGMMKRFWRSKTIKKDLIKDNIDIYHGLSNEIPYGIEKTQIKSVVTIHDLIFKTHPQFYMPFDVLIYDQKFKSSCLRADKIVAISNYTKSKIVEFYKIKPEKIDVIYLDCNEIFYKKTTNKEVESIKEKFAINSDFFLNVGSIGGRKNQFRILDAFAQISQKTEKNLVFVANNNKNSELLFDNIKKYKLENRCKILSGLNDENLHKLYHASYATVYPSLIEGFGIPIIESYRSRKPVITSKGSSLEEIAGSAALLCNPANTDSISENFLKIINNELYNNLIQKIDNELHRFSPENTTDKYMNLYNSII